MINNNSKSNFKDKTDENSILQVFPKPVAKHAVQKLPATILFQNGRPKRRPSLYNLHDSSSEVKNIRMDSLESSREYVASSHHTTIGLPRNYFPSDRSSGRTNPKDGGMRPRRFPQNCDATAILPGTTRDGRLEGQSKNETTTVKRTERNNDGR